MQKRIYSWTRSAGLAAVAALVMACGNDSNPPMAPGIQPQIINAVDNFQFQVTAVDNYSGALNYTWTNTGPQADINQSCAISSGTVTLILYDVNGQQVYSHDLSQNGTFASTVGTSGKWRVRVSMLGASGDLNFRVDKRTP